MKTLGHTDGRKVAQRCGSEGAAVDFDARLREDLLQGLFVVDMRYVPVRFPVLKNASAVAAVLNVVEPKPPQSAVQPKLQRKHRARQSEELIIVGHAAK